MSNNYDSSSITVLSGLDPVRKRPGMYTDTSRPNHLAQEVVDNSVDEAMAGHANLIVVRLLENGGLEVTDNGRGMPVDVHPEKGIPGVELILTQLHAGGKFENNNYDFSGGLHGVGVSVVTGLSTRLEVEVSREGKKYLIATENGTVVEPLHEIGPSDTERSGTTVRFWPDPEFFDSPKIQITRLASLLRTKCVLCPGLEIQIVDSDGNPLAGRDGVPFHWQYDDGLSGYLPEAMRDYKTILNEPITASTKSTDPAYEVEWAINWDEDQEEVLQESFANLIPTPQGGTHVNGLFSGLVDEVRNFAREHGLLKNKKLNISSEDIRKGCSFALSLKIKDAQFSGQTKERLSSREAASYVAKVSRESFALWLANHPKLGSELIESFIFNAESRARKSTKVTRKRISGGPILPGKLADCQSDNSEETELFLVEGDSAGGSAKQARNKVTQAILPLRGKILNSFEEDTETVLRSEEVNNIVEATGVNAGEGGTLEKLRYNKICVLADADSDGLHIAVLVCTLFYKHFPEIVKGGHLYIAQPPLYRVDVGKEVFYALDEQEREAILTRVQGDKRTANQTISVVRFKGLGEMNASQLADTTMRPETRRLVQVTLGEPGLTEQWFDLLLAKKKSSERRAWITNGSKDDYIETIAGAQEEVIDKARLPEGSDVPAQTSTIDQADLATDSV